MQCQSCPVQQAKKSPDIQRLSPWANTGNSKCQQVPGHHHQLWPPLVCPCWGCSRKRKLDSGVPAKELQGVFPKSQKELQECTPKVRRNFRECTPKVKPGTYTAMVCPTLEHASAVQCPHNNKDIQLLGKLQLLGNYNAELPGTWPTTTWTCHRHCYLHAHKSDGDKPWTTKMTDPPGDALQNQPWPCRCKPSKVLPPLWPQDQRSTKTAPGTGTTPRPLQLLTWYSLYNTTQYNTTLLPQYNTTLLKECQYTAWGMFCDAKDTHSHTFTPIIKHLITTTAKKHPGEKSFTEKNLKTPMASSCAYHIKPWMEPPPHGCFFSPFTQVLPESTRPQSSQCAASPHPSMNTKTVCIVLTLDWLFYLKF